MIRLASALARLVGFLLLLALAVTGLALAVFCIGTGTSGPSLGGLASLLGLDALRDSIGGWLAQLEAPGSVAMVAALSGLGTMVLGLVLVAGILVPRRERLVMLAEGEQGTLAARRRALSQVAGSLVEQVRGVTDARIRVRPGRRSGGRLSVRASRTRKVEAETIEGAVQEQLGALTGAFALTPKIDVPRHGARVQ